jgi:hypothetical protein
MPSTRPSIRAIITTTISNMSILDSLALISFFTTPIIALSTLLALNVITIPYLSQLTHAILSYFTSPILHQSFYLLRPLLGPIQLLMVLYLWPQTEKSGESKWAHKIMVGNVGAQYIPSLIKAGALVWEDIKRQGSGVENLGAWAEVIGVVVIFIMVPMVFPKGFREQGEGKKDEKKDVGLNEGIVV